MATGGRGNTSPHAYVLSSPPPGNPLRLAHGVRITGSSITNVGGSASVIAYAGHSKSKRDVGWEVRGVTTHRYTFSIVSATACMQVRGGASGLYSRSIRCSLA